MKRKLFYIADFSLPNMSAYALHVLKMCDAFFRKKTRCEFIDTIFRQERKFKKT